MIFLELTGGNFTLYIHCIYISRNWVMLFAGTERYA